LKEIYNQFDKATIQSYSTIATRIREKSFCKFEGASFKIEDKYVKFEQISIAKIEANKVYLEEEYFNVRKLISEQLRRFD
ncbi:hypothetical protein, partial [Robertkochia marina]